MVCELLLYASFLSPSHQIKLLISTTFFLLSGNTVGIFLRVVVTSRIPDVVAKLLNYGRSNTIAHTFFPQQKSHDLVLESHFQGETL